jgi:hypothetical protein
VTDLRTRAVKHSLARTRSLKNQILEIERPQVRRTFNRTQAPEGRRSRLPRPRRLTKSLVMALVVLQEVHVHFPIYESRDELHKARLQRTVGRLV